MAPRIPRRVLNDGNSIPTLAYGTGTAQYSQDVTDVVKLAIKTGFTHLDGAQVYANEDSMGAGIATSGVPRSSLYVTSKFYKLESGQGPIDAFNTSLKKLNTEYIDLYLIHGPKPFPGRIKELWEQTLKLKETGKVKSVGVSNFRVDHLEEILKDGAEPPAVNQIELHPYVYKAAAPILELHKKYNIATASYGGLTPIIRKKGGPLDPVVASIRERLEKDRGAPVTEAHVLEKWLEAKDAVIVTTSSKEARLKEYLDAPTVPALTPEEVKAIDEAGSKLHYRAFGSMLDD